MAESLPPGTNPDHSELLAPGVAGIWQVAVRPAPGKTSRQALLSLIWEAENALRANSVGVFLRDELGIAAKTVRCLVVRATNDSTVPMDEALRMATEAVWRAINRLDAEFNWTELVLSAVKRKPLLWRNKAVQKPIALFRTAFTRELSRLGTANGTARELGVNDRDALGVDKRHALKSDRQQRKTYALCEVTETNEPAVPQADLERSETMLVARLHTLTKSPEERRALALLTAMPKSEAYRLSGLKLNEGQALVRRLKRYLKRHGEH